MTRSSSPVQVFPILLSRVSGTSPTHLLGLRASGTALILARVRAIEHEMEGLAASLDRALFRLVPELADDAAFRRAVLRLKRDVHNARAPSCAPPILDRVEQRAGRDAAAIAHWREAVAQRQHALDRGRHLLDDEAAATGALLRRVLSTDPLARGLALASPTFVIDLTSDPGADAGPCTRLGRTCVSYLARAATKTSPFSTLTTVGLVTLDDTMPAVRPAAGPRRVTVASRALFHLLLHACARHPELAPALILEVNRGLLDHDGRLFALLPRYTCEAGFFWRHEEVLDASPLIPVLDALRHRPTGTYAEYLALLGGGDAAARLARLVELQLVRPVAPWHRDETSVLGPLANALGAIEGDEPGRVAGALRELSALVDEVGAASGPDRPAALRRLKDASVTELNRLGQRPPAWLEQCDLVHEDVAHGAAPEELGAHVRADLLELAQIIRPRIFRTALYDLLVEHFLERYGAGSVGGLLDFLYSFLGRDDADTRMRAALMHDQWRLDGKPVGAGPAAPGDGGSAGHARASASVVFQLAATDANAVRRGSYRLVVNQYSAGLGALVAGWVRTIDDGAPLLREALRRWLEGLVFPGRPHEVAVCADWSGLQQRCVGLLPPLHWPSELATADRDVGLHASELRVAHDRASGTLGIVDPGHEPIVPVYLGVVPQYLVLGPLRLLLTLGNPWLIGSPTTSSIRPFGPSATEPREVEHSPRASIGRLVLSRTSWRVPVREFPRHEPREALFDFMRRAHDWRSENRIPTEVFLTVERPSTSWQPRQRKPVWVSFESPHALVSAGHLVDRDSVAVHLAEALPGLGEHWLHGQDGLPRASEFVALISWADEPTGG